MKKLWLEVLPDSDKHYWRSRLSGPDATNMEISAEIEERYGIKIGHKSQITRFRQWIEEQDHLDDVRETREDYVRREIALIDYLVRKDHPDWTELQVESEVLVRAQRKLILFTYAQALATGVPEDGLTASREHRGVEQAEIERRKLKLIEEKAAAFDKAQKAVEDAKLSPGGLTPDTLAKIELALKLHAPV